MKESDYAACSHCEALIEMYCTEKDYKTLTLPDRMDQYYLVRGYCTPG